MNLRRALLLILALHASCDPHPAGERRGIISLVPSATEILFAIGAGPDVVGVSDYCNYPEDTARLPRYGGFLDPSTERIVASGARAVVLSRRAEKLARACRDAGMEVATVGTDGLADMDAAIEALGALTGRRAEARALRERIHAEIEASAIPSGTDRRVAVVVDRSPDALKRIFVAGPGSLLDDLLEAIGAVNVFADAPSMYPMVSLEGILSRRPDLLIDLRPFARSAPSARASALALWHGSGIVAPDGPVGAVHVLETTDFTVHGPRTGRAAGILASIVHGGGE